MSSSEHIRLNDYLEGDLQPAERSRLEAELAESRELRQELQALRSTVALLQRLPQAEAPPWLVERVVARVRAGEAEPERWWDWLRRLTEPAVAVPVAAGVVGLVLFAGMEPDHLPGTTLSRDSRPQLAEQEIPASQALAGARAPASPRSRAIPAGVDPEAVRQGEIALAKQLRRWRASQIEELARLGRSDEAASLLRGAGHPHSNSLAEHFAPSVELAAIELPGRRGRR